MGKINLPPKAKLIVGLLWGKATSLDRAKGFLTKEFGAIQDQSDPWEFTYTDYYQKELGGAIQRRFVSFSHFIEP